MWGRRVFSARSAAVISVAAVLLSVLVSAAVGGTKASSSRAVSFRADATCSVKDKTMVYVSVLRENPILRIMAQGAIDGAKASGFKSTKWLAAQGFDEAGSAALGDQAIAQGVDGIVVFATSPAFYPMIARAKAAGIPVVQAHSVIPKGKAPGVYAVVAPDPVQFGAQAALALGKKIGGKGKVAITQSAFIPNENAASASFTKTMKASFPNVEVLKPVAEGGDPSKAIQTESSIIQANPGLVGVFGTNGNVPVTWPVAARDNNATLTIIGMDYARANLDAVKKGDTYAIIAQPLYEEHYRASQLLKRVLCKQPLKYHNTMPAPIVTQSGLARYYTLLAKVKIR